MPTSVVPENLRRSFDVVVVGAGIIGAACAYHLTQRGLSVAVVDRGSVAAGTTGAGEGNILVSDKGPGPELDLALLSRRLWRDLAGELGPAVQLESAGGLVVARRPADVQPLLAFAAAQSGAGVDAQPVDAQDLRSLEPHLAAGLGGGVLYAQDMQIQPMLAAAHLLRLARRHGATVLFGQPVIGLLRRGDRVTGVRMAEGEISAGAVVNAAGTWGGELAAMADVVLPVLPRRGFILVTEALPQVIRHTVYTADYVANVASSSQDLETSTVVERTASGPLLIGASRERVGFDRTPSLPVLAKLAREAVALFPFLAQVRALRTYPGFRPYCPDHLPVIGPDPRAPGLFHACGHEGAGIGLAPATGLLIADAVSGSAPSLPLAPFAPERFETAHV